MKKATECNAVRVDGPVCPYCRALIYVVDFRGYYDKFSYWCCECADDELRNKATDKHRGGYA